MCVEIWPRPDTPALMDIRQILSDLRSQRNRLHQAILALEADGRKRRPGRRAKGTASNPVRERFHMSAAARKRIAEAKQKWWGTAEESQEVGMSGSACAGLILSA